MEPKIHRIETYRDKEVLIMNAEERTKAINDYVKFQRKYEDFWANQNDIYKKFDDKRQIALAEGLNKHPYSSREMYLIYFVHPSDVSQRVEEFSKGISKIVPSTIIYYAPNVHTTISDYILKNPGEYDGKVLSNLCHGAKHASEFSSFQINYDNAVGNQDTVTLKGYPKEGFLKIVYSVLDEIKGRGTELRMPWGAHITCARINDRMEDKEQVRELFNYIDSSNMVFESRPTHVGVGLGVFSSDGSSFKLNKLDEYKLR